MVPYYTHFFSYCTPVDQPCMINNPKNSKAAYLSLCLASCKNAFSFLLKLMHFMKWIVHNMWLLRWISLLLVLQTRHYKCWQMCIWLLVIAKSNLSRVLDEQISVHLKSEPWSWKRNSSVFSVISQEWESHVHMRLSQKQEQAWLIMKRPYCYRHKKTSQSLFPKMHPSPNPCCTSCFHHV